MVDPELLVFHAANADAEFVGRFVGSLKSAEDGIGPVATFCLFGYLSLFVHESSARLNTIDPVAAATLRLTPDASRIVARSRHSLKLFDDTKRGLDGQLRYFSQTIIPAHRAEFIDGIKFAWLRRFGTDLGIAYYDDEPVSSTHSATFSLGIPPADLFRHYSGPRMVELSEEYGRYFAAWGARIDQEARSFATEMSAARLRHLNVRSHQEYRNRFNGSASPEINALLSVFQASMNTMNRLLPLDPDPRSTQTVIKIRFLTIYQVLRSLGILLREKPRDLQPASQSYIRAIISQPTGRMVVDPKKKPFRNTLMHYGIDRTIDLSKLLLDRPLYGLVELFFGMDVATFDTVLSGLTSDVASQMNEWATVR